MVKIQSPINYNYATIKITQGRIDKGLIAIPVSMAGWFPKDSGYIHIYLDDSDAPLIKRYSSYNSTTKECRIGGLAEWFKKNEIKDGDEIVIQVIDKERFVYRLISEKNFLFKTRELQNDLDRSKADSDASDKIGSIAEWTETDKKGVILNEYRRLIKSMPIRDRRYLNKYSNRAKEDVPSNLRVILEGIYEGHCQVCDFWFLKRDHRPYFEIHHINPLQGNHPQNLIVVCANCHRQFEYANVKTEINNEGWLIRVFFNNKLFEVNQILLKRRLEEPYKQIFY